MQKGRGRQAKSDGLIVTAIREFRCPAEISRSLVGEVYDSEEEKEEETVPEKLCLQ